jgi:hypothetical protein
MDNPLKNFAGLRDPRVVRNRDHLLEEILLIQKKHSRCQR